MSGPLHKNLVARVCRANPGALTADFWPTLTKHLTAESGDFTAGEYEAHMRIEDAYSVTRSEFDRQYLAASARALAAIIGCRILPDAYQLDERWMTVVIWEVSVTNSQQRSEEKWDEMLLVLDSVDEWTVAVISVDARGICTYREPRPDQDDKLWTWSIDDPCPIDWSKGVLFTDRVRNGGVETALAKSLAGIRLAHDHQRYTSEEEAA
jgi:hypothetical protein